MTPRRGRPHQTRGSQASTDSLGGLIMWLPPLEELPRHTEISKGCYGHPAVVLSPRPLPSHDVVVLIVGLCTLGSDLLAWLTHWPTLDR